MGWAGEHFTKVPLGGRRRGLRGSGAGERPPRARGSCGGDSVEGLE